jgi:hypothetical protein
MSTAAKIVIPVNMRATACDAPVVFDDIVIERYPEVLGDRISAKEWSSILRKLKNTVRDNTHSSSCVLSAVLCSPLIAMIYFSSKRSKLEKRIYEDIQTINQSICRPRGMLLDMKRIDAGGCCSNPEYELVLALTADAVNSLAVDPRRGL